MTHHTWLSFALIAALLPLPVRRAAAPAGTLLLRSPTVSANHVAFVYAGDLWVAPRAQGGGGGEARRLTVHPGRELEPRFSPDGRWIAFTGEYDGNLDVYVVSVDGGDPRRLTYHPGPDLVQGWTPDGKQVLFSSARASHSFYDRLFTVPVDGGFEEPLPMPMAERGAYAADGGRMVYNPPPQPLDRGHLAALPRRAGAVPLGVRLQDPGHRAGAA